METEVKGNTWRLALGPCAAENTVVFECSPLYQGTSELLYVHWA